MPDLSEINGQNERYGDSERTKNLLTAELEKETIVTWWTLQAAKQKSQKI